MHGRVADKLGGIEQVRRNAWIGHTFGRHSMRERGIKRS